MQKLFMTAAALAIAIATAPSFIGQSQAASAKNPYCALAKSQRNAPAWNEYYGCLKTPARRASAHRPAATRRAVMGGPPPMREAAFAGAPERGPGSSYCKLARLQRNAPSWNEYYGCLHL